MLVKSRSSKTLKRKKYDFGLTYHSTIFYFNFNIFDILFNIFRRDRVEGDKGNEGSVEEEEEEAVRGGGRRLQNLVVCCVFL